MDSKVNVKDSIFRAYDVRGVYPDDIDEGVAYAMGRAFGTYIHEGSNVAVSMDVRTSSPALKEQLVRGILDSGVNVRYIGVTPTPTLYFAIARDNLDGGIAVSASHNPPKWNGFKVCGKNARVVGLGFGLEEIRDIMKRNQFNSPGKRGVLEDVEKAVHDDYEKFAFGHVEFGKKRLNIGIDSGNGACAGFAAGLLANANVNVNAINDDRDGRFPSRDPEPKPETIKGLCDLVLDKRLDLGVAFDGDGDRAIFVDEKGSVLHGDRALALLVKHTLKRGERVIYEVCCSDAVDEVARDAGCTPIVTKVGHQFIEHAMLGESAAIGGEISGHLYFRETYGFDDAFFATVKMIELLSKSDKTLSELVAELPHYETYVGEFQADDERKFAVIDKLREQMSGRYDCVTVDGVKAKTHDGWFIARASNTSPKIKVIAEARTRRRLAELAREARDELAKAYESAGLAMN